MHTRDKLEEALLLLSEFVGENIPPERLIISGGAVLAIKGLVARTTKDVDVVALLVDRKVVDARPLPKVITDASLQVARTLGLNED